MCTGGGVGFLYELPGSIIWRDDEPMNQSRPSGDIAAFGWIRSPFHPGSAPSSAPKVVTVTWASWRAVQLARSGRGNPQIAATSCLEPQCAGAIYERRTNPGAR